jgi:hypothetical protein
MHSDSRSAPAVPRWVVNNPFYSRPAKTMKQSLVLLVLVMGTVAAHSQGARVFSDAGSVFIERGGAKTKITASEMDVDPVLAPNGAFVVYTRQGRSRGPHAYAPDQFCPTQPRPDELRRINVDGSGDRVVLKGRSGAPERQLCDFTRKQFSSDGRRLYFLSPAWAASGALHVYDLRAEDEEFLLPANDLLVLSFCANRYKDYLVAQQRRYFFFGGSYDWYWLYDPAGKKEIGPVGDFRNRDDLIHQAQARWCTSER